MLTEIELKHFESLVRERQILIDVLRKNGILEAIINLVIDTYKDTAHFIFELLQNADDAKAKKVRFSLTKEGLFFAHNGKINFSVSDPLLERNNNEIVGHINSITTFSLSKKTIALNQEETENRIGKFGIGFKSVFQYTNTPYIFNPPYNFLIKDYFVPELLTNDNNDRKDDESTLFYLPFNSTNKSKDESYNDIKTKLDKLTNPLLFLHNIEKIECNFEGKTKLFSKKIKKKETIDDIVFENLKLDNTNFVKFSRFTDFENKKYRYSVAFLISNKAAEKKVIFDESIENYTEFAYCFFPTKEITNLKFLIHAPFKLTPNREGIKEDNWNSELLNKLAILAADSLPIFREHEFIDDDFFNVLPIVENDYDNGIFYPFFEKIKEKLLSKEKLLPTSNLEKYTTAENTFLADSEQLFNLLNYQQLSDLVDKKNSKWIFRTIIATGRNKTDLGKYLIEHIKTEELNPYKLSRNITVDFIKKVKEDWLHKLYKYLLEGPTFLFKETAQNPILRTKPIILLENEEIVSPYDPVSKKANAFLPTGIKSEYPTVKQTLYKNENSKKFLIELGLKIPELKEEINYKLIQRYNETGAIAHELLQRDFLKFFEYSKNCPSSEKNSYLNSIKELSFLSAISKADNNKYRMKPSKTYYPSDELKYYFKDYNEINWLNIKLYESLLSEYDEHEILEFLKEIGVHFFPKERKIEIRNPSQSEYSDRKITQTYSTDGHVIYDYEIEGLSHFFDNTFSLEKSVFIASYLETYLNLNKINLRSYYRYYYYSSKHKWFDSNLVRLINKTGWLFNKHGICVNANEIFFEELHSEYDLENCQKIFELLQFKTVVVESIDEQINKLGFSKNDILSILKREKEKSSSGENEQKEFDNSPIGKLGKEILKKAKKKAEEIGNDEIEKESDKVEDNTENNDNDEFTPKFIDTEKEFKKRKEVVEKEIALLAQKNELTKQASESETYSFAWFKALLGLEFFQNIDNQIKKNPIRVIFSSIEQESENILILNGASSIPNSIEDNGDLKLTINFKDKTVENILIDVVSPKKNILKAKVRDKKSIIGKDFSQVDNAIIEVKNADFIFQNLKTAFEQLPYDDNYNFKDELADKNIEFIFGPPGTGKTTYLANWINENRNDKKILVLCPTNKACDVITEKILETNQGVSCYPWLIRYGITKNAEIENSETFYPCTPLPNSCFHENVLITTTARISYDSFEIENHNSNKNEGKNWKYRIRDFYWDYIIFDEASMINLPSIIYSIFYLSENNEYFQENEGKFLIGGDPFQIEPIVQVDFKDWKDGNIYKVVELDKSNSFTLKQTPVHNFTVIPLQTQYRSIPSIGEVFSKYLYSGILKHNRTEKDILPIKIKNFGIAPINLINFRIDKYEPIYKPRYIKGSSYHIYSSIFTVEFIKYLLENIDLSKIKESELPYKIGVISPYRIQTEIIEKLISKYIEINQNFTIDIGTVHGFQGDQCNMIVNVLNPPLYVSGNENIFLNKKNLLNVSISRAKDYMFILVPYSDDINYQNNINQLFEIKKIRKLIKENSVFKEFKCFDVEKILFPNKIMIEDFCFPTSHQNVNVYVEPDKKYEIRYDENAIDIQLKK